AKKGKDAVWQREPADPKAAAGPEQDAAAGPGTGAKPSWAAALAGLAWAGQDPGELGYAVWEYWNALKHYESAVAEDQDAAAAAAAADQSWAAGTGTSQATSRPGKRKQGDAQEEPARERREAWQRLARAAGHLERLGIGQDVAEQAVSEFGRIPRPGL